jgi:lipopolysaccharide transport system ATP-binding protein
MVSVNLKNISLNIPIYSNYQCSFKSSVINNLLGGVIDYQHKSNLSIRALDNINIDLKKGDKFGILGHNGSGKTSLLRVIAGVYKNYTGSLLVNGSISSLLDISLGMDIEATGFENIRMRGVIMDLKLQEIKKLEKEIGEFSELGNYLNLPIRTYSSGMIMRLGFAISTSLNADILIMDEWLSVGDESFQIKSQERLKKLISDESILIIASQSKELINSICNKQIELKNGQIVNERNINYAR